MQLEEPFECMIAGTHSSDKGISEQDNLVAEGYTASQSVMALREVERRQKG